MVDLFQAQLSLIHVVELPTVDIFPEVSNKQKLYTEQAKEQLADFAKKLKVPIINQHVEIGNPKIIIPEFINQYNIGLLIIGHHERRGIYHLLGSTAYAVLSHLKCDVLTLPYSKFE